MSIIQVSKDSPLLLNEPIWYFPASNTFAVIEITDSEWKAIKTKLLLVNSVKVYAPVHVQISDYTNFFNSKIEGVPANFPDDFYKGYSCLRCSKEDAFTFYKY